MDKNPTRTLDGNNSKQASLQNSLQGSMRAAEEMAQDAG